MKTSPFRDSLVWSFLRLPISCVPTLIVLALVIFFAAVGFGQGVPLLFRVISMMVVACGIYGVTEVARLPPVAWDNLRHRWCTRGE